jgi:hypothetical protein
MKLTFLILIKRAILFVFTWIVIGVKLVHANDTDFAESTQWSAFVSQTAIYSSDYNFLSQSDDRVSLDLWEAGALFTASMAHDVTFSTQLLGRKVSEYSDEDIRLDYAFLSIPFYSDFKQTLGVRLGRIRSSYGFYNETRDIPHTRTGVIMPQAVYFDKTRNSFFSSDGIEFYGFRDFGEFVDQRLGFQLFISKPLEDKEEAQEAASLQARNLDGDKSFLAKVSYGSEIEGFRVAFTYYRPEYDVAVSIPVSQAPLVVLDEDKASFYSENLVTSIEYNSLNWSLTVEYIRHKFFTKIPVLDSLPGFKSENAFYEEAYYLQGLRRISQQWETYIRYDATRLRGSNAYWTDFNDLNAGISFRPDEHWLIRYEFHYIQGRARLFTRDNEYNVGEPNYWHAGMLQIAYRW